MFSPAVPLLTDQSLTTETTEEGDTTLPTTCIFDHHKIAFHLLQSTTGVRIINDHPIIMKTVAGFMTPADRAVTADPNDTIRTVMDAMLGHRVGAVVVVVREHPSQPSSDVRGKSPNTATTTTRACGIITKSDVLEAYHCFDVGIDRPCLEIMTNRKLGTCTPEMSLDRAAQVLAKNRNHHAIVVDAKDKHFVGVLSTWDITVEYAKQDHSPPHGLLEAKEENKTKGNVQRDVVSNLPSTPPGDPLAHPARTHVRAMSERNVDGALKLPQVQYHTRSLSEGRRPESEIIQKIQAVGRPGIDFSAGLQHDPHLHDSFRCYMEDLGLMLSLE